MVSSVHHPHLCYVNIQWEVVGTHMAVVEEELRQPHHHVSITEVPRGHCNKSIGQKERT